MMGISGRFPSAHGHILLVDGDSARRVWVRAALESLAATLTTQPDLKGSSIANDYDLVIVHYDTLSTEDREELTRKFCRPSKGARLLICSNSPLRKELVHLFGSYTLTNLLAQTDARATDDLLVTARKILEGNIFGLERYIPTPDATSTMSCRASIDKPAAVAAAAQFASGLRLPARVMGLLHTVVDEFVTNALFNAPVSLDGGRRFAHLPRSESVTLGPNEEVELTFASDAAFMGISIADPFGSLTEDRVLDYLARCFRKGTDQVEERGGGAGLGLYYIFDALSHLIINIRPGEKTEMIGLLARTTSYREFVSRPKSFNIFVDSG